jgi:hypothetical protein
MQQSLYQPARPLPRLRFQIRGVLFRTPLAALAVTMLVPLVILLDIIR